MLEYLKIVSSGPYYTWYTLQTYRSRLCNHTTFTWKLFNFIYESSCVSSGLRGVDSLGGHTIAISICDIYSRQFSVVLLNIMVFTEAGSFDSPWLGSCLRPYLSHFYWQFAFVAGSCRASIRKGILKDQVLSYQLDAGRAYLAIVTIITLEPSLKANRVRIIAEVKV
jgi:hypothetical protein